MSAAAIEAAALERDVLVMFLTRYCNIECDHCIVDSGRRRRGKIDRRAAEVAIEGAAAAGMRAVVFSGGESLVYEADLAHLCGVAHRAGLGTRVFTNGFWARSVDKARAALERFANLDIDELVVSMDVYHLPWMPADRVRNVIEAAATAQHLPFIYYQMVIDPEEVEDVKSGDPPRAVGEVIRAYGLTDARLVALADVEQRCIEGADRGLAREAVLDALTREHMVIQWLPAFLGGRALRQLPMLGGRRSAGAAIAEPCPVAGRQVTVTPGGQIFPCCSSWSNFDAHALGAVAEGASAGDVAALIDGVRADPLVRAIHHFGPGAVIEELRAEGRAVPDRHADVCDMCSSLMAGFSAATLREAAERATDHRMMRWLLEGISGSPEASGDGGEAGGTSLPQAMVSAGSAS